MLSRIKEHIKQLSLGTRITLCLFFIIVLFADFIANEKPVYCKIKGKSYSPILIDMGTKLGIRKWPSELQQLNWTTHPCDKCKHTIIPFSSQSIPGNFKSYQIPGSKQQMINKARRHWLGTDKLGRDVAAGMIHGTRVAFFVGIISMLISLVIGLVLGVMAGYFGDYKLKLSMLRMIWNLFLIPIAWFYAFAIFQMGESIWFYFFRALLIVFTIFTLVNIFYSFLKRLFPFRSRRVNLAMDFLVSRGIEIFTSIPGLFLLLAFLAVIQRPSIWNVILIVGLIRWPSIARLARAEMLAIREQGYIKTAEAMGLSGWQIIRKHALPNGINSIIVACAFGIAVAVLLESSLSFLGIGLAPEEVTWGSLLGQARQNISAWWLSIFPGLAIFGMIILFNGIGNQLQAKT